ncbi:hypothetical protein C0J52_12554 [Blattella germanica]|nr:hypothetical protein C0J52_12554 [Blattella germanica]
MNVYFVLRGILFPLLTFCYVFCLVSAETEGIDPSYLCSKEYCEEQITQTPCEELPKKCNETNGGIMMLDPSFCNCCDYCLQYLKEGDDCVSDGTGQPLYESICGPGLGCDSETRTCIALNTPCMTEQVKFDQSREDGTWGFTQIRPLCDARGFYHPAHCIGTSICYCVNPDGERIFGEKIYSSPSVQETMNCECSLAARKAELLAAEMGVHNQPIHCLEDGSYDLLQCNDDMCYCLDEETKIPDMEEGPILEINIMEEKPQCFDTTVHTKGKYKRECEEKLQQMLLEIEMLKEDGITVIGQQLPDCQYDGRYNRVMVKDNETRWLMKQEGLTELPSCCDNGNFKQMQCRRGECYCVDCNGNQLGVDSSNCKDTADSCTECSKPTTSSVKKSNFVLNWEPNDEDEDLLSDLPLDTTDVNKSQLSYRKGGRIVKILKVIFLFIIKSDDRMKSNFCV